MTIRLAYGKESISTELPDNIQLDVLEPQFAPGLPDQTRAVAAALQAPIGGRPLREIVRPSDQVGIIFSDITRPTPYNVILPAFFAELAYLPDENFVLFNATGTHRPNTPEELERMLGPGVVGRYRIVQNDCTDRESHRLIGTTRGGNDVWVHRDFLDCDVKVPTGFIEPHFFAGFSGGGKAIMPGLALLETIQRNHSAGHMDDPNARWGIVRGNPLWEEVREASGFAEPTFLLNVALNRRKEITAVFAGDFDEAHAEGCEYVREHAMAGVSARYDVVITSNSGYPLDLNMYQAVKGMSAASQIVKEGGDIIVAADCWDGIPDHGEYGMLLTSAGTPAQLLATIRSPGFAAQDMWQAQIHASICETTQVHFYSHNLTDEQIESAFMRPCRDIAERVREIAARKSGEGPLRVCVLPEGPQTIPYLRQ